MFFVYIFWVFFIGFLAYLIYGFIYKIIKGIGNEEERPQRAIALIATVVAVAVLLGIYFLFFKEKPEVKSRNEDNNTSYVKQRILTPQLIPFDGHHGFSVGLEGVHKPRQHPG